MGLSQADGDGMAFKNTKPQKANHARNSRRFGILM